MCKCLFSKESLRIVLAKALSMSHAKKMKREKKEEKTMV